MKIYTINLIRHGITEGNLNGEYIGRTDRPLCDDGREKLKEYKEKYKYPQADAIFSSPMCRCTETAEIIYGKSPVIIDEFRECDFGDFEGKTYSELQGLKEFEEWHNGGFSVKPPNGESWKDVAERTKTAFVKIMEAMLKTHTENVTIITHGGIIMTIMSMFGYPQREPVDWFVKNGCGFTLQTDIKSWMKVQLLEATGALPYGKENIIVKSGEKDKNE